MLKARLESGLPNVGVLTFSTNRNYFHIRRSVAAHATVAVYVNSFSQLNARFTRTEQDTVADEQYFNTMKIGNHAAFSGIRRTPGTSLPGAPKKCTHQSPRSKFKILPAHRVQGLRIIGGNVGVGGE